MIPQVLQCVSLNELERVVLLGDVIDSNNLIEARSVVPDSAPTGPAKQVEQSHISSTG
jgi:hypothetical protein